MSSLLLAVACLPCVSGFIPQASSAAAPRLVVGRAAYAAIPIHRLPGMQQSSRRTAQASRHVSMSAAAAHWQPAPPAAPLSLARAVLPRLASTLAAILFSTIFFTAKAFAAARTASYAASGDMTGVVKWGGVGVACGAAYLCRGLFQKQPDPVAVAQAEQQQQEQQQQQQQQPQPLELATEPMAAATDAGSEAAAEQPVDDFSLASGLRARMLELAQEVKEEVDAKPADEGGDGSTALLERPTEEVQGDAPAAPEAAADLPLGYPLRTADDDWELEPPEPPSTASEDEIALLERMFGTRSD